MLRATLSNPPGAWPAPARRRPRDGAILIVVLAMLALFAVIGLSFVLYSEREASAARLHRDGIVHRIAAPDLAEIVNLAIAQFVSPTNDAMSALHGHDLATLKYGGQGGTTPYNGVGLFHERLTQGTTNPNNPPTISLSTFGLLPTFDRSDVINFTPQVFTRNNANTVVKVDPEYTFANGSVRVGSGSGTAPPSAYLPKMVYVPKNAGYTYPDRNNAMVAMFDPGTLQVVLQSGVRPNFGGLQPTNPNWTNAQGRFMILRPRPAEHQGFPFPPQNPEGTYTGDVQNIRFANGIDRNDSVWMNLNLPPVRVTTSTGTRLVQPLIAPILLPLDGLPNLNVAGNLVGTDASGNPVHASKEGFSPHEINPGYVLAVGSTNSAKSIVQKRFGGGNLPPQPVELPASGNQPANSAYYPNKSTTAVAHQPFQPGDTTGTGRVTAISASDSALNVQQILPPLASSVDWLGKATGGLSLPQSGTSLFGSAPSYAGYSTNSFKAYTTSYPSGPTGDEMSHPLTWNPYSRTRYTVSGATGTTVGVFPAGDLRRTAARSADRSALISGQTVLGAAFGTEFADSGPNAPSNQSRALVTTVSTSHKRPALAPNFLGDQTVKLTLAAASATGYPAMQSGGVAAAPTLNLATINATPANTTQASQGVSDLNLATTAATPLAVQNARAALSSIDLNRVLKDYRMDLSQTLGFGPVNLPASGPPLNRPARMSDTNVDQYSDLDARQDRQAFATEIFTRLAVATGAAIRYDQSLSKYVLPQGTAAPYTLTVTGSPAVNVTQPEYDALRWLAQYAANIVDALDPDDISTPFVWNPTVADPQGDTAQTDFQTAVLNNRVVFGVEKPRLVINEAYAELTNDPIDKTAPNATKPFQARFFLELVNPTRRDTNTTKPVVPQDVPLNFGTQPAYKVLVLDDATALADLNQTNQTLANVLGTPTGTPRIACELTGLAMPTAAPTDNQGGTLNPALSGANSVEPNDGNYQSDGTNTKRYGFGFTGPQIAGTDTDGTAFVPASRGAPFTMMIQKPQTQAGTATDPANSSTDLAYYVNRGRATDFAPGGALNTRLNKDHTVLLQRVANPYLAVSTVNPYQTVDVMGRVKLFDAVRVEQNPVGTLPSTSALHTPTPLVPPVAKAAIGRVQPYAGYTDPATAPINGPYDATTTVATSLVLAQQNPVTNPETVKHSFMQHNGTTATAPTASDATLNLPFEWMPHFDRRLINQAELLHVPTVMAHELTFRFAKPNATGTRPYFHLQTAGGPVDGQQPPVPANPAVQPLVGPMLDQSQPFYRALELLSVKPWMRDIPEGGRVPGKINVNMIWDKRVLQAALDKQAGNTFTAAEVDQIWTALQKSRSPGLPTNTINSTRDEVGVAAGALFDRPFKSFGVGLFQGGGSLAGTAGTPFTNVDETLLRMVPTGTTVAPATGQPSILTRYGDTARQPLLNTTDAFHPYKEHEPLRKLLNNVTTTSDTFLLVFTVGYFEIIDGTPGSDVNPARLGQEVYRDVPGDLRAQFCAVLDRTNLMSTPPAAGAQPWVSELQNNLSGVTASAIVQPQLLLNVTRDTSSWSGTYPPPQAAEALYSEKTPVTLVPNMPQEFYITPVYNRTGATIIPDGTANAARRMYVNGGRYEPRSGTDGWELRSDFDPNQPISATNPTGTQFTVGAGQQRVLMQAYYDGTQATQWTYDPLNGRVRFTAKVVTPQPTGATPLLQYPAGSMVSNVEFGATGGTQAIDVQAGSPVVTYFGRLTP